MQKLVHAAFRAPDGTSYCCGAFHDLNCLPPHVDPDSVEDGFLTDKGEFLTREQATQDLHADHPIQSEELDLAKGAMQRLAPFNPQNPQHRLGEYDESELGRWQSGEYNVDDYNAELGDRPVPHNPANVRLRSLHRLAAATRVRQNPATGEHEYLLHRGMSPEEHKVSVTPDRVNHENASSWTPRREVARGFGAQYSRGTPGMGHTVGAWVPESAIASVPKHWGKLDQNAEVYSGDDDYKPPQGPNNYSPEYEVIVHGGHNSALATPEDLQPVVAPLKTVHGRINRAGEHDKMLHNMAHQGHANDARVEFMRERFGKSDGHQVRSPSLIKATALDLENNSMLSPPGMKNNRSSDLVAVHNLSAANLHHAHRLGGLSVPSLAITHRDHVPDSFGEISLVAHPSMVDPKQGAPTYDADVYSPRHPRSEYKVRGKAADALHAMLKPSAAATGAYIGDIRGDLADSQKLIPENTYDSTWPAFAHAYLASKGQAPETPMRDKSSRYAEILATPAMQAFKATHGTDQWGWPSESGPDYEKHFGAALRQAAVQADAKLGLALGDPDKNIHQEWYSKYFEPDGQVAGGPGAEILRELHVHGQKEVDPNAAREALLAAVKDDPGFAPWMNAQVAGARGQEVFTPSGRQRSLPYTLDNIVGAMSGKIKQGEGFNYGLGTARAAGAHRFTDLNEIRNSAYQLTDHAGMEAHKKQQNEEYERLDSAMERYRPRDSNYSDALMGAIGDSMKPGKNLPKALRENGFANVPPQLMEQLHEFRNKLKNSPTEYFESKPQRAVGLNEFRGAAVPDDTHPDTLAVLKQLGLPVVHYKRGDAASRSAAVRQIAEIQDLHLSEKPLEKTEDSVLHLHHGTRNGILIRAHGFKPSTGGEFGPGIYLTGNPDTASFYAHHVAAGPDAPEVLPVEASIMNPFRVSKLDWIRMTQRSTPGSVQKQLRAKGHDGIIGVGINGHDEQIVAFNAHQVRHAPELNKSLNKTEYRGTDKKEYEHVVRTWLQQRLRESLGTPDPASALRKSMADICPLWKASDGPDDLDDVIMGAASRQAGFDVLELPEFRAAKFMAGGRDLDPEREREALRIHGDDVVAAALWAQGIEITDVNRDGLKAVMASLRDSLRKADLDVAALPRDVEPVFPESEKVTEALRRAFVQRNVKRMALKGKHSLGVAVAYDEKTEKHYLLKPGSGALSPAAGIREEAANQSRREVAFAKIAQAWGLGDDLPGCELVVIDGVEVAAMDLLDPDYVNIGKVRESAAKVLKPYEENGRLYKWAVMDLILGQADRHSGNLMCNPRDHDKVKLIDEGSSFAGPSFAPGQDTRSYIPYYLRAFSGENFKKLSPEKRLDLFPHANPEIRDAVNAWIQGLSETETRGLLVRYGISVNATLDRLNQVQAADDGIEYVLQRWAGFPE